MYRSWKLDVSKMSTTKGLARGEPTSNLLQTSTLFLRNWPWRNRRHDRRPLLRLGRGRRHLRRGRRCRRRIVKPLARDDAPDLFGVQRLAREEGGRPLRYA